MKIDFGFNKVVITCGLTQEGIGVIRFEKSLKEYDINRKSIYDVPITLYFSNIASIDVVIKALEHVKEVMTNEK